MRVNNNDENLVHSDLVYRYSRTAQALKTRHGGFTSDLEAAIDRDTVKTPDPLFAGIVQRYEQANTTASKDPAITAPAQTESAYTGRDTLLMAARYSYWRETTPEKPDPLFAAIAAKYERAGTIPEHRDPAIISPA